ncbi:MAG TPA: hypothetical protein VGO07_03990, partial [Candidatus Saccharimonadales bacterium]|nr:hypothetical protein [Candidatus Saccharimonadales bacterium]
NASAAATPAVAGLPPASGDTVTGLVETYNTANAGSGKTLTVSPTFTVNDGNAGNNYTVTTRTNTAGVINKADPTIVVTAYTVTYNSNPHTAGGTAKGVLAESLNGLDLSHTTHSNAHVYSTDYWVFTDSTGNYKSVSNTTITDTINKADPTVTVTPYSVNYDATSHKATGTVKGVSDETLSGLDLSGTVHTNAKDYVSDPWIFTDSTGNYNSTTGTTHDSIASINATTSVNPYSVSYDGNPHTAQGTASGVGGVNLSAYFNLSGTTHTNAGDYLTDSWTFTDPAGNYNPASGVVQDSIARVNATIYVPAYSVPYDGASHTAPGTATGVNGVSLVASLNLGGTTHTNAGDYLTDSWSFTDPNYNPASGTLTNHISKVNAAILISPYHVTYDGDPHMAGGSATGVGGVNLSSGLNFTGTLHTNAGNYSSDPWSFSGAPNYNDAGGTTGDIIDQADANIVVTPYNVPYDGSPHTASGTATGVKGESLSGLDLSGTTHTIASSYPSDPWTFTDVTGNYKNTNGTTADSISAAGAPLQITAGPVTGFQNYTYPATLLAATGGTPPYTWSGASIPGLNLTSNGVLTGVPTAEGVTSVTVTDANSLTASVSFTIAGPQSIQGAGSPSVTTISDVSLTGVSVRVRQIATTPGAPVTVNLNYNLVEGGITGVNCPACIDQLAVAFVNTTPTTCAYNGQPGPGGISGSAVINLVAPSLPGRYYIAYHKYQQFG